MVLLRADGGMEQAVKYLLERQVLLQVLERQRWRMTSAATELGLERSHLYKKLKALGIERPD